MNEKNVYFLISPFEASDYNYEPGKVMLVDFNGNIYKTWKTKYQPFFSILTKSGELYVSEITPYDWRTSGGGKTGLIEKFDKDGKLLWSYENKLMHHDFFVDGENLYVITFKDLSSDYKKRIKGGHVTNKTSVTDEVLEINKEGKTIWRWSFDEHIDPSLFTLNDYTSQEELTHSNSVKYYKSNPFNHRASILISSRHLSTIFLVDKESGQILWQSPRGMLSFQHDASLNATDGTIMAFDNGNFRDQEKPLLFSRIVKINPLNNKIVWQFDGGETAPQKASFFSSFMGGAQELADGRIIATYSTQGKVLLISPDKRIISEYLNKFFGSKNEYGFPNNTLFKVQGYDLTFLLYKTLSYHEILICQFFKIFCQ